MLRVLASTVAAALATFALTGCAGDVRGTLVPAAAAAPDASRVTMLVATTRKPDDDAGVLFSGERAPASFAEITVSLPPDTARRIGEVQWPSRLPGNPETDFVTSEGRQAGQGPGPEALSRDGAARAQAPRPGLHPRLQQPLRGCGLSLRPDRPRSGSQGRPHPVHPALARLDLRLWLRSGEQ